MQESIAKISGTSHRLRRMKPEGHEELDEKIAEEVREEARRGPFRFSDVDIEPGSNVQFVDNPTIEATVVDDRHIFYDGQTTSLSALAQSLKGFNHPVQGTICFSYQGEVLDDRRKRMEKEK